MSDAVFPVTELVASVSTISMAGLAFGGIKLRESLLHRKGTKRQTVERQDIRARQRGIHEQARQDLQRIAVGESSSPADDIDTLMDIINLSIRREFLGADPDEFEFTNPYIRGKVSERDAFHVVELVANSQANFDNCLYVLQGRVALLSPVHPSTAAVLQDVRTLLQRLASHLLLNVREDITRANPGSAKQEIAEEQRAELLTKQFWKLAQEVRKFTEELDDGAKWEALMPSAAVPAETRLVRQDERFTHLTSEEQDLCRKVQASLPLLDTATQHDVDVFQTLLLDAASMAASAGGDSALHAQVRKLAAENRMLAVQWLQNAVLKAETSKQEADVKKLRTMQTFMARQES